MEPSKWILKTANTLISFITVLSLFIAGAYAGYALWDNSLVYGAVDDVHADMMKLKPKVVEAQKPSLDKLRAINPDVRAWVTLDNTNIDYPVLQGKTNLSYINTDVYGNFAFAGSIFLDSRNDPNFNDTYSLLYGHHMENGRMFGDLDLYKKDTFFRKNQTGTLIVPGKVYKLEIFACLIVPSSESLYEPERWQGDIDGLLQYVDKRALYLNKAAIEKIKQSKNVDPHILALSTCSSEFTDARTVILAMMEPSSK